MQLVKLEQAQEFNNSDKCKVLEYPTTDKDINFSTGVINGRYPDKGYCVNEECTLHNSYAMCTCLVSRTT